MKHTERSQALYLLTTLLQKKTPLAHLLQANPTITPLTKAICFGVCRYYVRLEALANRLVSKRPSDTDVWLTLLIGLYQLESLHAPDYAVVQETVALLDRIKKSWAKGFVNATLRTYCRQRESLTLELNADLAFLYAHPAWLVTQLQHDWPNDWEQILHANNVHPPMSLRINQQVTTTTDYIHRLQQQGIHATPHPQASNGIILDTPCDVHALPGFDAGELSVQDTAAQLAVTLLDLKPGLRLLDACAAPGGKTGHILESEPGLAACVALDIDAKRLTRVAANLARLNLQATLVQGDALQPDTWWDGSLFDRILLDAPCSAVGVIRRHPDIKLLRQATDITAIAERQQAILHALWPLLAPGGLMLYATCSIMHEENANQIATFLATHPEAETITGPQPWGRETGYGWQILPGDNNMDGFFYSVLKKKTDKVMMLL